MAAEVRGTGVTVTVLCPGPVETEFAATAGFDEAEAEASLPKIMWVPAAEVAKAAVDGMERGRMVVIPGTANRIGAMTGRLVPHRLLLPILAKQHPSLKA
jgi:short-subunit dehydrogenase